MTLEEIAVCGFYALLMAPAIGLALYALKELFSEVIGRIAKKPEMNGNLEHMIRASAMVIQMIDDAPTVQPERKKGEWIRNDNGTYSCSACQSWIPEEQHYYARYCLYCGADMRGKQDEVYSNIRFAGRIQNGMCLWQDDKSRGQRGISAGRF